MQIEEVGAIERHNDAAICHRLLKVPCISSACARPIGRGDNIVTITRECIAEVSEVFIEVEPSH